ncbi:hypothetical protein C0989_004449 [Termitomyces sp. Mn162]|nr:hypothetical protein C0989_004449 [Termitomyces sp. Mn162]
MTKLSTLCQTMDLIFQSLKALLEHLSPNSAPPTAEEPTPSVAAPTLAAPVTLQLQIPCLALPDAYDSACSIRERFLQSCLTYIHLSRDAFDSDVLKIAWVLSYMKTGHASTHVLQVFCRPREQEELLLQLLAARDTVRAPPLDEPKLELTLEEDDVGSSPLEFERDF